MTTIEEKYAKFSISDEMKEKFDHFYSYHSNKSDQVNKVVVQTTDTKEETLLTTLGEKKDGELV